MESVKWHAALVQGQLGFVFWGEPIYVENFEIPEKRSLPQLLQVIPLTPSVAAFDKVGVHLVTCNSDCGCCVPNTLQARGYIEAWLGCQQSTRSKQVESQEHHYCEKTLRCV